MTTIAHAGRSAFAKPAIAVGVIFPLVMPWGFWRTGVELVAIAEHAPITATFFEIYLQVLISFRYFLVAYLIASIGRLMIAWGALRLR